MSKTNFSKKIIIGNWKMNPESGEMAKKLFQEIKRRSINIKRSNIVICPPSIFFNELKSGTTNKIQLGLQNVHFEKSGSFTGEISAAMAKKAKAKYVIIGHSERRNMGESDEIICKKIGSVLRSDLVPILCIGEKEVDGEANHLGFIKNQLIKALGAVSVDELNKIIIAYEPVYAIGASQAIGAHDIYQRNIFIKKVLTEKYGKEKAFKVPILYGGAVNIDNAKEIVRDGAVDGLLIGRESLNAEHFVEIIKRVESL
jgi:triosephosphate isomerase (TIM)